MIKSLAFVQRLCKVFRILCIIGMVLCFIGAFCCLVSIPMLTAMENSTDIVIDNMTAMEYFSSMMEEMYGVSLSMSTVNALLWSSVISCTVQAVTYLLLGLYFKHEIKDGSPFTSRGAKEMLRIGIISLVMLMVSNGAMNLLSSMISQSDGISLGNTADPTSALPYFLFAALFWCGEEMLQNRIPTSYQNDASNGSADFYISDDDKKL